MVQCWEKRRSKATSDDVTDERNDDDCHVANNGEVQVQSLNQLKEEEAGDGRREDTVRTYSESCGNDCQSLARWQSVGSLIDA